MCPMDATPNGRRREGVISPLRRPALRSSVPSVTFIHSHPSCGNLKDFVFGSFYLFYCLQQQAPPPPPGGSVKMRCFCICRYLGDSGVSVIHVNTP